MWRSSGVLYLPYIFRTLKRVYKLIVVISTKLLKISSFCRNMACGYRERAGLTWATSMCGEWDWLWAVIVLEQGIEKKLFLFTSRTSSVSTNLKDPYVPPMLGFYKLLVLDKKRCRTLILRSRSSAMEQPTDGFTPSTLRYDLQEKAEDIPI